MGIKSTDEVQMYTNFIKGSLLYIINVTFYKTRTGF